MKKPTNIDLKRLARAITAVLDAAGIKRQSRASYVARLANPKYRNLALRNRDVMRRYKDAR